MKERILVAVVGLPLLFAILVFAPPWATTVLTAALSAVCCYELMHAVGGDTWKKLWVMPLLAAIFTAAFSSVNMVGMLRVILMVLLYLTILYGLGVCVFTRGKPTQVSFGTAMAGILSATAISSGFACLSMLRATSPALVLMPIVGAFMSDTGAFFVGSYLGKHKLAPAVSPKKTVEGCIGGFVGSVLGMALYALLAKALWQMELSWGVVVGLGLVGSLMGQLGDLCFSVIKREYGIKDFGRLFLAHGGALDRFDSVLLVAPAYWLMLRLVY